MNQLKLVLVAIYCLVVTLCNAQVEGKVIDENGEVLPFVTIYVVGTSKGTVSNLDGEYKLEVEPGEYRVNYKYIGYKEVSELINTSNGPVVNDVVLEEEPLEIGTVTISADAEDPAYRVIRNAIKKRKFHYKQIPKYETDLYVKGVVKLLDSPQSILGIEIGDMEGVLDSTGQGIVYLGESQSRIYFHQPNLMKEDMYSSIVAEDDGSFNVNRFKFANFNVYKEYFEFSRSLIGPIADNALLYYKYKLISATYDAEGRLVNKIQVIPKSKARPVFFGHIYIIEDTWRVKEFDLSFTGKSINEPIFDTIHIQQVHVPIEEDKWVLFSQVMDFKLGGFGFKIGGDFTYVFSDYNINPDFDKSFFTAEDFVLRDDSPNQDTSFWNEVRPIQLTEEERQNYIKKDSLKKIWNSKEFKDSLDRVNNKFKLVDLLLGYTRSNTYKKRYFTYSSPLTAYRFNAVEGSVIRMGFDFTQVSKNDNYSFNTNSVLSYGFADKKLKLDAMIDIKTDKRWGESFTIDFGDSYRQYYEKAPVLPMFGTVYALFNKRHEVKLFRKRYIGGQYKKELINGLYFKGKLGYARRSPLVNNTNYSFFYKDREYESNHPFDEAQNGAFFETHNHLQLDLAFQYHFGQTYSTFPKFRLITPTNWPILYFNYRAGIPLGDTDYHKIKLGFKRDDIDLRLLGTTRFNVFGEMFLSKESVEFIDFHHFYTNESYFNLTSRYDKGFKLMPHYEYSTTNNYLAGFFEHNFDGFILDMIPLANRLGWSLVVSANCLVRDGQSNYYEFSTGISNIRIGALSLFRLDYVRSYGGNSFLDHNIVIGFSFVE